jgi:RNA polymerase sigma factor (sigma-70 family)
MMTEFESDLLQRFRQRGDAEAFAQITRQYAGMVFGTCLRITGNQAAAADAAQDTFFELSRSARKVTGSLGGWLHRVATRRAIDLVRSESSRTRREQAYAAERPLTTEHWADVSPVLDEALGELEEAQREVLIRHFLQGETVVEIAATEGVSQPTMSRRMEAALDQLCERLRKRGVGVAAAALGVMMAGAAQDAPAVVLVELGKIALASTGPAAASTPTATVIGLNAKLAVAAAVAVVGVGGYVAYRSTRPAETTLPATSVPLTVAVAAPAGDPTATVSVDPTAPAAALASPVPGPMTVLSTGPAPVGGMAAGQGAGVGVTRSGGVSYGSMPMGSGLGFGGYSTDPAPTRATAAGALTLFANALVRGDPARWLDCFDGAIETNPLRRALENPTTEAERELQRVLWSLGPPVEVMQTTETVDGLKVKWKATVRQPFTTADNGVTKTWQRDDRYELELRLKQIGGEWKIVGF